MRKLVIKAKPPYSLDLSMKATQPSAPTTYTGGTLTRALRLQSGRLIPVQVRQIGGLEDPKVEVKILADVDGSEEREILGMLDRFLCLTDDMNPVYEIMDGDPTLRWIGERLRGVRPWTSLNAYEGLICGVLFQQISLNAAFSIIRTLVQGLGDSIRLGGVTYYDFPTPERLAEASVEELRALHLSRNKALYVKGIARRIVDGFNPEALGEMPLEDAVKTLTSMRGVGVWTAEIVLATGLKRWEVVPADDLGIRRAVSKFYLGGRDASRRDVTRLAESWGDYKWPIAYYLLVASERLERLSVA